MAFDAKSGKKLWSFQTGSGITGLPIAWERNGTAVRHGDQRRGHGLRRARRRPGTGEHAGGRFGVDLRAAMSGRRRAGRVAACLLAVSAWVGGASATAQTADAAPSAERGRQLYNSYCARCHGINMVTPGAASFDLRTLTPGEQERFERSVTHGLRAMPAWGSILKPADVQALWTYVMAGR